MVVYFLIYEPLSWEVEHMVQNKYLKKMPGILLSEHLTWCVIAPYPVLA
jgi:hypothetical protein